MRCFVGLCQRQVRENALQEAGTAGEEEEHRVEQYEEMKDEQSGRAGRGGERGEEEGARAPDEFAGLGEDLRSVGLDAIVTGQSPQSPIEFARLIDELLETRPDGLGDAQRFIGPGPEHREQWCHHQHQQQHERCDRRKRPAAIEPCEYPLIHGIAQARKDGRQQDRQQERADHRDECGGDRGDQQEEKGLAAGRPDNDR
jgi:hypothetical protein